MPQIEIRPATATTRRDRQWRLLVGVVLAGSLALRLFGLGWGIPQYDPAVMPHTPYRQSYHIDEDNFLWGLLQMRPAAGNFDVVDYHWGTLQHYLIYGVLLGGSAVGIVPAPWEPAFQAGDVAALPRLYVLGRLVSVVAGGVGTWIVLGLGLALGGRAAGLAGGAAYAVAPLAVTEAHYLTNDVTMSVLAAGAVLAAVHAVNCGLRRRSPPQGKDCGVRDGDQIGSGTARAIRWLIGAGLLLGLATAAKYSALFAAPGLLAAQVGLARLGAGRRAPGALLLGPWLAAAGGFLLGEPYALLKPGGVLDGLQSTAQGNAADLSGEPGLALLMWRWQALNLGGLGLTWPPALLAAGGLALLALTVLRGVLRRGPAAWPAGIVLAAGAGLGLALGLNRVYMLRYSQPLVPLLAVAAGLGWAALPWRAGRIAAGAVALAAAGVITLGQLALFAGPHPANDLQAWLQVHLRAGQQIARLWPEYPALDMDRYRLIRLDPWRPDLPADAHPDYIIMDDMALGPSTPALVQLLAQDYTPVAHFGAQPQLLGWTWPEGPTPHDWKYSHPTFTVYQRVASSE